MQNNTGINKLIVVTRVTVIKVFILNKDDRITAANTSQASSSFQIPKSKEINRTNFQQEILMFTIEILTGFRSVNQTE